MAIGTNKLKITGVYRIAIGPNFYVGSSVNIENRIKDHRSKLESGKHPNRRMLNAFRKYEELDFEVVSRTPHGPGQNSDMLDKEQEFLDLWFSEPRCMNLSPTARNTFGVKHSPEARANMSKAHIGRACGMFHHYYGKIRDVEVREKIRKSLTGRSYTPEQAKNHKSAMNRKSVRAKISKSSRGRKQSEETIRKRIAHQIGSKNQNARQVWVEHDSFGRLEFGCIAEASRELKLEGNSLRSWLRGQKNWPGTGRKGSVKYNHLTGLKGGYL